MFGNTYSSEYLHLVPHLQKDEATLTVSSSLYAEEKTYEKDLQVIDLTNQEGYVQTLNYKKATNDRLMYEIEIQALISGKYNENYSGSLNFISDKKVQSYGIKEPIGKFYYWFPSSIKNFDQALFASYRPKLYEPKAHQFFNGRHEITLSYLYKYQENIFEVSGEVFSTIFGKKEVRLDSGAEDTIDSFTEVGLKFTPGIILETFSIHLLSSYSSMTDYNTRNQFFERYSDKGYAVEIGGKINWKMLKNQGLSFSYLERESYFNSIEEDLSRNIEFEIDSEEYKLSWWILL